jgi:putative acetyltransferase
MAAQIFIRRATAGDTQGIVQVHFAAVHQTASVSYPSDVLFAWSAKPDEKRWERVRLGITFGEEIFEVAEIDRVVRGFGVIVPANRELRALYVEPAFGRRGIATAILARLEDLAVASGLKQLHLNASLNAEAFYRKHGYAAIERGVHRLSAGINMDCVRMIKEMNTIDQTSITY